MSWRGVEGCLIRGKGNMERRVSYSTGVAELIDRWLVVRGDDAGSLFWLHANGIYRLFPPNRKETGLPIHPHQLRHQEASYLVRNNADVHSVKRILGHGLGHHDRTLRDAGLCRPPRQTCGGLTM
jgi:site-specific recombinase XerD